MYSVSTLEMTIFREIILLVRVNFRSIFLSSWLTPDFDTLMGGNTCPLLPPIGVSNYEINQELRKVHLKYFQILGKIVISRVETLYVLAHVCYKNSVKLTFCTGRVEKKLSCIWMNIIAKIRLVANPLEAMDHEVVGFYYASFEVTHEGPKRFCNTSLRYWKINFAKVR